MKVIYKVTCGLIVKECIGEASRDKWVTIFDLYFPGCTIIIEPQGSTK